jgi:hypothetical protein
VVGSGRHSESEQILKLSAVELNSLNTQPVQMVALARRKHYMILAKQG